VFIHGLFSSAQTWSHFDRLVAEDPALAGFAFFHFEYASPKFRFNPTRRIPNYNDLADSLGTYLQLDLGEFPNMVLVSHSQGGLIIQRYLARMLANSSARQLTRIRRIIMFACPNSGSQIFLIMRMRFAFWRNPQERSLRPIDEAVTEAQRLVLNRVVHATEVDDGQCPIHILPYAGDSDRVVTPTSARGVFPNAGVIPGDHFSIIQPTSLAHRSYTTLQINLLAAVATSGAQQSSGSAAPSDALNTVAVAATPNKDDMSDLFRSMAHSILAGTTNTETEDDARAVDPFLFRWDPRRGTVELILSPVTGLAWVPPRSPEDGESDE
jgi:pimeloyl-ACP methyl ester carboxylesterase